MEGRFLKYGGIARVVLGDDENIRNMRSVSKKLSMDLMQSPPVVVGQATDAKEIRDRLLIMKVKDSAKGLRFKDYTYEWCSDYVCGLVAKKFLNDLNQRIGDLTATLKHENASVRGQLFERMCHTKLLNSSAEFRIRRIVRIPPNKIFFLFRGKICKFPPLKELLFQRSQAVRAIQDAPDNSYLVPIEPNFPVVDAIVKINSAKIFFLQMTIAKTHSLKSDEFDQVLSNIGIKEAHIVFVVQPGLYASFKPMESGLKCKVYSYCLDIASSEPSAATSSSSSSSSSFSSSVTLSTPTTTTRGIKRKLSHSSEHSPSTTKRPVFGGEK